MDVNLAEKCWHRLCLMVFLAKYSIWYNIILCVPTHLYIFLTVWPKQYLFIYGTHAYLSFILWLYYISPFGYGLIFIFHSVCYFLKLRFIYVNDSLENILKAQRNDPSINRSTELLQVLHKHNQICVTISQFNKFWCFQTLIDAILNSCTVLLMIYVSFFTTIVVWLRMFIGSFAVVCFLCYGCVFISAAFVATQVFKIYFNFLFFSNIL